MYTYILYIYYKYYIYNIFHVETNSKPWVWGPTGGSTLPRLGVGTPCLAPCDQSIRKPPGAIAAHTGTGASLTY